MPTFNRFIASPFTRLIAGGMILFKLWLVAAQPVVAIGGSALDDWLFLQLAQNLLNGQWLGPYDQYTLAKGPMYSIWIAGSNLVGVPFPFGQHLLYLLGCGLLTRSVRPYLRNSWVGLGLFLLLWWNPMSYNLGMMGRVLRQNIYLPLSLLLFAAAIALNSRRHASRPRRIAWGCLLGGSFSALWLTREESVWVLPSLALLVGAAVWASWKETKSIKPLLAPLASAAAVFSVVLTVICVMNARYYGWFGTVEFRAPEFVQAYGALQRVLPTKEVPFTPVTREAREKIYRVSPAFAELRPLLEGSIGQGWARASLGYTKAPIESVEIAGGWFMWALRDSIVDTHHPRNAREALGHYARIAAEVNRACDDGRLPAGPRRDTFLPTLTDSNKRRIAAAMPDYVDFFLTFKNFTAFPSPSMGSAPLLTIFRDLSHWHLAPSPDAPELTNHQEIQAHLGRLRLLQAIGKSARWVDAIVAIGGIAAWLVVGVGVVRGRRPLYPWLAATAVLGAVCAVVLINGIIHSLSFFNRSPGALLQAYPLILLLGWWMISEMIPRPAILSSPANPSPDDGR